MKVKLSLPLIACAGFLLGGCVLQSINPLFVEKEYIPFPELVGRWVQKGEDKKQSVWRFEPDGRRYKLTHADEDGHPATFEVAAGRIGTNLFLSCYLADPMPGTPMNLFATVHYVGIYSFAKVRKAGTGLALVPMDVRWLAEQLEKDPRFVPHVLRPNGPGDRWPLLTGSTEELQRFVAKYAEDKRAFPNEIKLVPDKLVP